MPMNLTFDDVQLIMELSMIGGAGLTGIVWAIGYGIGIIINILKRG